MLLSENPFQILALVFSRIYLCLYTLKFKLQFCLLWASKHQRETWWLEREMIIQKSLSQLFFSGPLLAILGHPFRMFPKLELLPFVIHVFTWYERLVYTCTSVCVYIILQNEQLAFHKLTFMKMTLFDMYSYRG